MLEADWLTTTDVSAMLECVHHDANPAVKRASYRKLRLFACACARQVWPLLTDERSRRAVEVAERYADGLVKWDEVSKAHDDARRANEEAGRDWPEILGMICCGTNAANVAQRMTEPGRDISPAVQADLARCIFGNPWRNVILVDTDEQARYARFPAFSRSWLTPLIVSLAEAAYSERVGRVCRKCEGAGNLGTAAVLLGLPLGATCPACHGTGRIEDGRLDPDRLAILADALYEAGCEDVTCPKCNGACVRWKGDITLVGKNRYETPCSACNGAGHVPHPLRAHLMDGGIHVRGCWALDLLTGRI